MRLGDPALTEITDQRVVVAVGRVREAVEQTMRALEHGARSGEARTRHQGGAQARLRCPAGVHALGPRPFGEIFDDAARHDARDAERIDRLLFVEPERGRDAGRRAHRAEHRGRVEARLVHGLRHHGAETAQHLDANRDALQRRRAIRIMPLARGKHRRHDHRAGVHRPALEGVVEILAMRGGAVHQRGRRRA